MLLQPSRPEARAALYNAGCCHVKLKQWQAAVDAVEEAVNEQGLKLNIAQEVSTLVLLVAPRAACFAQTCVTLLGPAVGSKSICSAEEVQHRNKGLMSSFYTTSACI